MKGGTTHRGEVIRHPCPYLGSSDGSSSHRSPWTRPLGSSSNHGTELLPKAVTVLGLIDIQENALLTRTLNSVELNSRSPSRTEAGFQV